VIYKKFIIFFFLLSSVSLAQNIFVCRSVTENGEPVDFYSLKNIPLGQSVTILLMDESLQEERKYFLFIDKIENNAVQNYFNKVVQLNSSKRWVGVDYTFYRPGFYKLYLTDSNKKKIRTLEITIGSGKPVDVKKEIPDSKYSETEIVFCRQIINEKPFSVVNSVSGTTGKNEIYLYINNRKPLNTGTVLINFWRQAKQGPDFDEFAGAKKFELNKEWNDTYFKISFDKTGRYKISLYDDGELLIKSVYFSVTN
jgi:hypothetical protein